MSPAPSPLVVGMDATTPPASVALVCGPDVLATRIGPFGPRTDAWILGALDELLNETGTPISAIDAWASTSGPGTFTGIRVGLATAAGLAAGGGRPAAGIGTLEALVTVARRAAGAGQPALAVVDARRGQVYAGWAPAGSETLAWGPELLALEALGSRLPSGATARVIGSGADMAAARVEGCTPIHDAAPLAVGAAVRAARLLAAAAPGACPLPPPLPIYVRPPDARPGASPLRGRRRVPPATEDPPGSL